MNTMSMSDQAIARRKHARCDASASNMADGPFLAEDDHTLVIPSDWYKKAAGEQWKKWGFRYHGNIEDRWYKAWTRDIRQPMPGYQAPHKPEVWLKSAREAFDRFWPGIRRMEEN